MIINYDNWKAYGGMSEGSGASEKIWLEEPETGEIGVFKYPKYFSNSDFITTEHISEKIASEFGKLIGIDCATVEIGKRNLRLGSMSYLINRKNEELKEGMDIIGKYYIDYDRSKLYDREKEEYYSLEVILKSLEEFNLKNEFLKVIIFDYLIGNTDRHQNNWAILKRSEEIVLCPLYDNGSSLCCYVPEEQICDYLGNDFQKFSSLVDSKSRSRIRIDKKAKKEPTHLEVLKYIRKNYYKETFEFVERIISNISELKINEILEESAEDLISENRKVLIIRFLLEKINNMNKIYKEDEFCV